MGHAARTKVLDRRSPIPPSAAPSTEPRRPPTSGIFEKAERVHTGAPDPVLLVERAKEVTKVPTALAMTFETVSLASRSILSTPDGLRIEPGTDLLGWLPRLFDPRPLRVPRDQFRRVRTLSVVAVPILTPGVHAGVLAVPTLPDVVRQIRQLEALATDFALEVEVSDRECQIETLALADALDVDWA